MAGHHAHRPHHVHDGDGRIGWAVAVNIGLTGVQVAGGVLSGSLALIADALHNFSDAMSLVIAWGARRIARRPADAVMTFGYARAEIVAALVNLTTLVLVGVYLGYEAVMRLADPRPIEGWTVVIVAGVALAVDVVTALLVRAQAKESLNLRAAFLHNLADAASSVAVMIGGAAVLIWDARLIDPLLTLAIGAWVVRHAALEMRETVRILMNAAPEAPGVETVRGALEAVEGVTGAHHLHLWRLDERRLSLEAHLTLASADPGAAARAKRAARAALAERFGIRHATLETEFPGEACAAPRGGAPPPAT
jgi:cobalt-zinc-cadmium efflux system protein